jgi:GR25 family glycosyltransferase involved in LPS biosynthesis
MDINKYFDKIFYINLKKDVDRNNNLLAQFNKFGITNYERFDAITFTEIPEPKYWRNFIKIDDDKYILNSLGCRASHLEIVKIAKVRGYGKILILEDDVQILDNLNNILGNNESILNDWDMLYFGGEVENKYRNQIVCSHAYALKHKIYDEIINMAIPSGMELDNFYAKILQHMSFNTNQSGQYNTRIVMPFNTIIQNNDFNSNIQS